MNRSWRREALVLLAAFGLSPLVALLGPGGPEVALQHGETLLRLQNDLGLPGEENVVDWFARSQALLTALKIYYASAHVSAMIALFVWSYVRKPQAYAQIRNSFVITQILVVSTYLTFPAAPPTFLPALRSGTDPLQGEGALLRIAHLLQYPYAAFPSGHIAFATIVCLALLRVGSQRLKAIGVLHLIVTMVAVVATNNHYWLDVGAGFFIACLATALGNLAILSATNDLFATKREKVRAIYLRGR